MASIKPHNGGYRAFVFKHGVRRTKVFKVKAMAVQWATSLEAEILAGSIGQIPNKTFAELLDNYADTVSINKRGKEWELKKIKYIKGFPIASVKLPDLNATHVTQYKDKRLKEVKPGTVRREWNLLSNACNVAVKHWKWLKVNPFAEVKRPPPPKPRNKIYSDSQIDRLKFTTGFDMGDFSKVSARVGAVFLFAIETGMRLKEITRLEHDRVFLDKSYLVVHEETKTGSREVPLSSYAKELIRMMPEGARTVFDVTEGQVDSNFRKYAKQALITGMTFHDTKHTACTRLAKKVNVFDLARIVGTRDLKTLMIYYNESASNIAELLG